MEEKIKEKELKTATPPVLPSVAIPPAIPPTIPPTILLEPAKEPEPPCQWFLGGMNFCDKIKKGVKCEGNIRKCPF